MIALALLLLLAQEPPYSTALECQTSYISNVTGLVVSGPWTDCVSAGQQAQIDRDTLHLVTWIDERPRVVVTGATATFNRQPDGSYALASVEPKQNKPKVVRCSKELEGVVIQKGDEFYVCTTKKRRVKSEHK